MIGILIFTITALILGTLLVLTDNHFKKEDDKIEQNLPGYNCGVCGFGSCAGMKEAILENPENYKKCKLLKNQEAIKYFESLKNKGFTLVELLAVVIILGILAVVIVPKIQQTLKDSKRNTYEASVRALDREADVFYSNQKINQNEFNGCEYNFTTNNNTCTGFEFKGQKPDSGTLKVYSNGETAFAIQFDDYCYTKRPGSESITSSSDCNSNFLDIIPNIVTSGDGLYVSEIEPGRLIYRGANPNNYINIKEDGTNNTLYRIVSYEPDGTIKVVRDEKLNSDMAFDSRTSESDGPRKNENNTFCNYSGTYYGCNVWGNMNNTYYNGQTLSPVFKYRSYSNNSSETLREHSSTGTVNTDSTLNQYLNNTWITDKEMSKYIDNHNFNVGGVCYYNGYTGGDKGIVREKEEEKLYTWTGNVGLLNITDYAESSTNSSCTDVWSNYYHNPDNETNITSNEWPCKYDNYNYKSGYHQWSLSPNSGSRYDVWYVYSTGFFLYYNYYGAGNTFGVRPAFYLKSSIILAGSGTSSDPFYIVE